MKIKTFSELVEHLKQISVDEEIAADHVAPKDDEEEVTKYKARSKGEQKFAAKHSVKLTPHPVADPSVHKGNTKPVGDHKGPEGKGEPVVKQGSSDGKKTPDGSKQRDKSKAAGPKTFGDLAIVKQGSSKIKESIEEETELDELSKKTLEKYFDKAARNAGKRDRRLDKDFPKVGKARKKEVYSLSRRDKGLDRASDRMSGKMTVKYGSKSEGVEFVSEHAFHVIEKIAKTKRDGKVKFANGRTESVDHDTAKALVKAHAKLNEKNKKTFESTASKSFEGMMKMMDFAMGGGRM